MNVVSRISRRTTEKGYVDIPRIHVVIVQGQTSHQLALLKKVYQFQYLLKTLLKQYTIGYIKRTMKRKSKKTLHRESRIRGIVPDRRRQNEMNRCFLRSITTSYGLLPTKVERQSKVTPKMLGNAPHVNKVSEKVPLSIVNLKIIKGLGYTTTKTRLKLKLKRIEREQRDLFLEKMNCRRRREFYRSVQYVRTFKKVA